MATRRWRRSGCRRRSCAWRPSWPRARQASCWRARAAHRRASVRGAAVGPADAGAVSRRAPGRSAGGLPADRAGRFSAELGMEPGEPLARLQQRILARDPTLLLGGARAATPRGRATRPHGCRSPPTRLVGRERGAERAGRAAGRPGRSAHHADRARAALARRGCWWSWPAAARRITRTARCSCGWSG